MPFGFIFTAAAQRSDDDDSQSKGDNSQSDYLADVETSSCASLELDVGCSDSEEGEGDVT